MRILTVFLHATLLTALPSPDARGGTVDWSPPTLASTAPATKAEPVVPPMDSVEAEPAVATAEVATPEPSVVRPRKKSCARGKHCGKRRAPKVDPRLAESAAIRDQILGEAAPLAASGRHEDAARLVATAATSRADPILYLAAAELKLSDGRPDSRKLDEAISMTREAERLVLNPVDLRIATDVGPGLIDHGHQLAGFATKRRKALDLRRRARGETIVGGVFLGVGLTGIGLLASGAAFIARVERGETDYTGSDPTYLAALDSARNRAESMLAAGLVTALVGTAIGLPLTIVGARDRRRAREAQEERPQLQIAPTLAGVAVAGRF